MSNGFVWQTQRKEGREGRNLRLLSANGFDANSSGVDDASDAT